MGSTKLTKPPKRKAKFLNPDEIPEATLESDNEDFVKKIMNNLGQISHCSNRCKHSHRVAIQCSSADTTGTSHHLMSPKKKMNRIDQQQQASSWWMLSHPGKWKVCNYRGVPKERRTITCNTYMTAPVHLAVSCWFLQKLSCWCWRLTDTTTIT